MSGCRGISIIPGLGFQTGSGRMSFLFIRRLVLLLQDSLP
jgi:hypothetical protein